MRGLPHRFTDKDIINKCKINSKVVLSRTYVAAQLYLICKKYVQMMRGELTVESFFPQLFGIWNNTIIQKLFILNVSGMEQKYLFLTK